MLYVPENQQHRWKEWLEDANVRRMLEEAAGDIAWAWGIDKQDPGKYPVNTGEALYQLKREIEEYLKPKMTPDTPRPPRGIVPSPPSCFSELISDRTIEVVYEEQNSDIYRSALQRAAKGHRSTFRKILRAIDHVYTIDQIGAQAAPAAKVQFFHRKLLGIADLAGLTDLKDDGILEFFDDLCPCGEVHRRDAIRKLRKRSPKRIRR
jgi:hypothetical protein